MIRLGLGLSRTGVRRMVGDGRIHLPLAPGTKVHQDFEFTVRGPGSAGAAEHPEAIGGPTGVHTDLSCAWSHDTPRSAVARE